MPKMLLNIRVITEITFREFLARVQVVVLYFGISNEEEHLKNRFQTKKERINQPII